MKVSWILSIVGMHRNMGFTVYCLGPVSLWHTNRKPWFLAPTPRLCIWLCIKDVQCACLVRLTHQPDDGARGLKRVKNTSRSLHHHRCTDSRSTSVATQKKKKAPTRDHHQHYQSAAGTSVPSWTSAICDSGQRTVGDLQMYVGAHRSWYLLLRRDSATSPHGGPSLCRHWHLSRATTSYSARILTELRISARSTEKLFSLPTLSPHTSIFHPLQGTLGFAKQRGKGEKKKGEETPRQDNFCSHL